MPTPLIAGNWKMNGLLGESIERVGALAARVAAEPPHCDIAVSPPPTLLRPVADALNDSAIALGGQDCHATQAGAHTGDVSAEMLADAGCRYVIVGHSERRSGHGESNALVRSKAKAAHRAGLVAVVCLGESEAQRDAGEALAVVERQLAGSLPASVSAADTVIAYEPVWAIGAGRTPSLDEIAEVHAHLRRLLCGRLGEEGRDLRLLYGGPVKPANAAGILAADEVNGALVGGASLAVDEFWAICRSCP